MGKELELIKEALGGAEADVTFDCVGFGKTMTTALKATSRGGKVCLVGMGHSDMTVPLTPAAGRSLSLSLSLSLYVYIYIYIYLITIWYFQGG